ncbi:MAG: M48 family metallopeptidase [Acidobacteria bacterium]|nr:M48 family metallopeptidase [Acidobacteriota bacterium]
MRINGLVSVFNRVRAQLQAGLTPAEVEPFKRQVQSTVREIEAICRRHGVTPEHLPAPSRRAYLFLRGLDLNDLPQRAAGAVAPVATAVRIKNVVKTREYFADRLWQKLDVWLTDAAARARLLGEFEQQATAIEAICASHGQTPAELEAPSRQVYCWLKFLSGGEVLAAHLDALARARAVTRQMLKPAPQRPLLLHLVNLGALWRRREYHNTLLLRVHLGFQNGAPELWRALLQCALGKSTAEAEDAYRAFAESEEFSDLLFELEAFAEPPAQPTQGRAHDLAASFARVNAAYFGQQMARPTLVWNRTLTARKFAHYQPSRDTVMVSVTLDDPGVSDSLLDYVMYHELLHKKHGSPLVNGRRQAHTPAFRADERLYAGYAEAERQLQALARRQHGLDAGGGDEPEE